MKLKLLLSAILAALLMVPAVASAQNEEFPDELVLGMVPSREAGVIVDSLEPLAQMLEERLLIPVDTFISTNYVGLVEAMGSGRVDIGLFGPAALVQAMDRHGAEVILASVRFGSTTYKSQFNIQCDSGIDSFEDLEGKTIAFVDPGSASGYQFPYVFLKNRYGIDPNTDMESIFAGSHDAAVLAVYLGDVDVAVSFNDAREELVDDYPDVMEKVCVLGYTQDIPNDGVVVRNELPDELKEQIQQALIDIAETEEGKALTQALFNVTAFAPIEPEVYDVVREVSSEFERD
ncbi:MAG TPA: phosphate/phosphite/phosphonate ABC transporter substrate-binding protein [Trueperaceae bacterium]